MNVGIGTVAAQFLSWEYLFRISGIVSLQCALFPRISSCCVCSVNASVSYVYAEGIQNEHLKNGKTDAHAEHAHTALMRMLKEPHQLLTRTVYSAISMFLTRMLSKVQ
jgi:hypothetical protein